MNIKSLKGITTNVGITTVVVERMRKGNSAGRPIKLEEMFGLIRIAGHVPADSPAAKPNGKIAQAQQKRIGHYPLFEGRFFRYVLQHGTWLEAASYPLCVAYITAIAILPRQQISQRKLTKVPGL